MCAKFQLDCISSSEVIVGGLLGPTMTPPPNQSWESEKSPVQVGLTTLREIIFVEFNFATSHIFFKLYIFSKKIGYFEEFFFTTLISRFKVKFREISSIKVCNFDCFVVD